MTGRAGGDAAPAAREPAEETAEARAARARAAAGEVRDPELPVLTLADLGVLREVTVDPTGDRVRVAITPTYSGCPALPAMREDLARALRAVGFPDVEVRVHLAPAWSSDWITARGRRRLAEAGIAPPGPAPRPAPGPVPLTLGPPVRRVRCPRCGSPETEELSRFSGTACRALRRCGACAEPFEHVKEI